MIKSSSSKFTSRGKLLKERILSKLFDIDSSNVTVLLDDKRSKELFKLTGNTLRI